MSDLVLDVSDLTDNPGASKRIERSLSVPGLRGVLGWVEDDERVVIDLVAESVLEGVEVSGHVAGSMHFSCSRCLVEFERPFDHEVRETFIAVASGEEERYEIEGAHIDLEPMVRDVVVLTIPPYPLHDPECKGLCPVCGADRNSVDCGHREEKIDLRWEPLKRLMEEKKG